MGILKKAFKGTWKGLYKVGKIGYNNARGILGINAGKESRELVKAQEESQRALDRESREENYQYGEMAADAAHQRSLALLTEQNQQQSLEARVADAKAAGISPGLVLGAGGGSGGSGGGAMGTGARGVQSEVPSYLDIAAVKEQSKSNRIEAARVAGEQILAKAEAAKVKAETEKIKEETDTSKELTPIQKALLREQAVSQWIDNVRKDWENSGEEADVTSYRSKNKEIDATTAISRAGNFSKQQAAEIAKAVTEADLNTEKKIALWEEVLNAKRREDTEATKAAAVKLAAEWTTGEYTNWKTWVDVAGNAIGNIKGILGQ